MTALPPRPVGRRPSWWWRRLELSANTYRSFAVPRPRLRGVLHRAAAAVFPLVVLVLVLAADTGRARVALVAFGGAMELMLATSAVVHLRRWNVWTTEVLFRLDHTAIFVAVAGTATPIALLGLESGAGRRLLLLSWGLALLGMVVVWWPGRTPVGFANTAFITLGLVVGLYAGSATERAGLAFLLLLGLGGAVYIVGAVLVALGRPDPSPLVFGYHEVWHVLVLVGLATHTIMVAVTLVPLA